MPRSKERKNADRKKFRIQREKVGCTWSHDEGTGEMRIKEKEEILEFVNNKFGQCEYTIGREKHKDGTFHYHGWFKFPSALDTEDSRCFDIAGHHPNIISPGKGWEKYCVKGKDYITNHYEQDPFLEATESATVEEAVEILWKKRPREMCLHGANIESNLSKRLRIKPKATVYYGPYPEHYYPTEEEWDPYTHSLLLYGPAGVNKTQFAKYYMAHTFGDYSYMKGHFEQGKRTDLTIPFIHDEVDMLSCDPENSKEITDVENGGTIICRHSNYEIPPGVPRIFLANSSTPFNNISDAVYGRRVISKQIVQR